jgi:hypothetical protein
LNTAASFRLDLAPFWRLLEFPNAKVQRLARRIISRQTSDRGLLVRQIFATLGGSDSRLFDGLAPV